MPARNCEEAFMIFSFEENSERTGKYVLLYDGIELSYVDIAAEAFSHKHEAMGHIMQINYCHAGQIIWNTNHGRSVFLNPGDFSVHTLDVCTDSAFVFPNSQYQGFMISVDLQKVSVHPPELLAETKVFNGMISFAEGAGLLFSPGMNDLKAFFPAITDSPKNWNFPTSA